MIVTIFSGILFFRGGFFGDFTPPMKSVSAGALSENFYPFQAVQKSTAPIDKAHPSIQKSAS